MIQQHCYTYTTNGLFRSVAGYDTVARSQGLDEDFIKERIHPLCFYKPSKALTTSGVPEESFPRAVIMARFPEGRVLIGQTVYRRLEDGSSHFFVYNYILPAGYKIGIRDVLYNVFFPTGMAGAVGAAGASGATGSTGAETTAADALPVLAKLPMLGAPETGATGATGRQYGAAWRDFFDTEKEQLLQLIFAVMQACAGSKKVYVVLAGDVRTLIVWLYDYLPAAVTEMLGFTTYSREPENKKFLHLIFMDVLRRDDARTRQDYIFDFESGYFYHAHTGELPALRDSTYLQWVWQCYETGTDTSAFHEFATNFPNYSKNFGLRYWDDMVDLFYIYTDAARLPSYDREMKAHVIDILYRFLPYAPELLRPLAEKIAAEEPDTIAGSFIDSGSAQIFEKAAFWKNLRPGLRLTGVSRQAAKRIAAIMADSEDPYHTAAELFRLAKQYRSKIAGMTLVTAICNGLLDRLEPARLEIEDLQRIPADFCLYGKKTPNPEPYMFIEILVTISEYLVHPVLAPLDFGAFIGKYPLPETDIRALKRILKRYMRKHITPGNFANVAYLFVPGDDTAELLAYIDRYAGTRKAAWLGWAAENYFNLQPESQAEAIRAFIGNNLKDGDFKNTIYKYEALKGLAREVKFGRIIGKV